MAKRHPRDDLILAYGAGSLGESWSLAVATHLALCPFCRDNVKIAEDVGGQLLAEMHPEALSSDMLAQTLEQLDQPFLPDPASEPPSHVDLPEPLRGYLGVNLNEILWKPIGNGAYQHLIPTSDEAQARLLKFPAGGVVPEHGHRGREITLVLKGNFEDELGRFGPGDMEDVDEEVSHRPRVGPDEDCVCLAVTDAPLHFRKLLPRVAQKMIGI